MVREVKVARDRDSGRSVVPFERDSIFDGGPLVPRLPRRSKQHGNPRSAGGNPAADRPATDRRHLAGADWLTPPRPRQGK